MANLDERNLNVTIKNESDDKGEVVISLSGIFKKLKKYFLLWVITAVVVAGLVFTANLVNTISNKPALNALVSFNYNGVEKGLDPAGGVLDANTIKNPSVISAALTKLDLYDEFATDIEDIRAGIKVIPITPTDAIDRMTVYQSILDKAANGNITAAQALLDTTYYPTQFKVEFSYSSTRLSKDQAVEIFNQILESYRDYFYGQYGYNETVGTSVTVINYSDYDYAEAVDIFSTNLSALESYVKQLSKEESKYNTVSNNATNRTQIKFRSNTTGYTFGDLAEAIETVKSIDLDRISSNITVNNLTRNKADTIAYYQYRIQALTRQQNQYKDVLATIEDAIASYEKDTIMVINGADNVNTTSTLASEEYDDLIDKRISTQSSLSAATQQIAFYTERKTALENSNSTNDEARIAQLEEQFATLNTKVIELVASVNATANEYYETVAFANAYSILVPAVNSSTATFMSIVKSSLMSIIIAEALLFFIYLAVAFITAIVSENKKDEIAPAAPAAPVSSDDDDETEEDEAVEEDSEEAPAEAEEKKPAPAKKNTNNSKKKR